MVFELDPFLLARHGHDLVWRSNLRLDVNQNSAMLAYESTVVELSRTLVAHRISRPFHPFCSPVCEECGIASAKY